MEKLLVLKRPDACERCGVALTIGTRAYWIMPQRVVRCLDCAASTDAGRVEPVSEDLAGGSAQRQYDRRSARELAAKQQRIADDAAWRETIRAQRPLLGRLATALTPKPTVGPESQSTTAWKTGAEGERRVAEVLAAASGVELLHDRRVPRSKANIDHIVVGPAGVFVVDAKKYDGVISVRDVGGLFRTDERLYVNGRDRTKLVDGVLDQVEVVRTVLGATFSEVPVRGVLCFVGASGWGTLRMRAKSIKGVTAIWPTALAEHVSAPGEFSDRIPGVADHLRHALKPA